MVLSAMALTMRTLEITVMSGEDLQLHRKPIKKKSFAIFKIDSQNFGSTQVDEEGGSYPFWNQEMVLNLPINVSFVTVEVHCGASSRHSIVGTARVPVSDFIGGYVPESYLHFLSYRLRDVRGERNGIVNFSVRVKVPDMATTSRTGIKVQHQEPAEKTNFVGGGGVAIGIPIWSGCPKNS